MKKSSRIRQKSRWEGVSPTIDDKNFKFWLVVKVLELEILIMLYPVAEIHDVNL